jgi:hypothetical protein
MDINFKLIRTRRLNKKLRGFGPGFDSRRLQIFWEAAGLERDPLSFVSTNEELLEGKVAAPV